MGNPDFVDRDQPKNAPIETHQAISMVHKLLLHSGPIHHVL